MRISAQANHPFRIFDRNALWRRRIAPFTRLPSGAFKCDQEVRWHFRGYPCARSAKFSVCTCRRDSRKATLFVSAPSRHLADPAGWEVRYPAPGRHSPAPQRGPGPVRFRLESPHARARPCRHWWRSPDGPAHLHAHSAQEWRDDGLAHAQRWPTACVARLDLGQPSSMCP